MENIQGTTIAPAQFHQITLTEWMDMKKKLAQELQNVTMSFVRIGYALRQIDDAELYKQDGYSSIAEFAKAEYGLEGSTVSRFMAINRKYSIDGYSERLRPEYIGLGQSKLSEMLALPDADMEMVRPEMSREDIRDLKRFEKTEPEAGVADDIYQLFEEFFRTDRKVVDAIFTESPDPSEPVEPQELPEIITPSGSRSYRKGLYFVAFYEQDIKIKKFGEQTPRTLSWEDLHRIIRAIFAESADGEHTYANHYGIEEKTVGYEENDGNVSAVRTPENSPETVRGGKKAGDPQTERRSAETAGDNGQTSAPERGMPSERPGEQGERDAQASGFEQFDSGSEPGGTQKGTEAIAPAQKGEEEKTEEAKPAEKVEPAAVNRGPEQQLNDLEAKISSMIRSLQAVLEGRRWDLAEKKVLEIRNRIIDARILHESIEEKNE